MSRWTVLVIDDDAALRELYAEALRRAGYGVVLAANGDEGLTLLRRVAIDLVVTDLVMPELDGPGLLRVLRDEQVQVPVIAVSGSDGRDGMTQLALARALGAARTLRKPIALTALVSEVQGLLDPSGHRPGAP